MHVKRTLIPNCGNIIRAHHIFLLHLYKFEHYNCKIQTCLQPTINKSFMRFRVMLHIYLADKIFNN